MRKNDLSFEAYKLWCRYYSHYKTDKTLEPYLSDEIIETKRGWLRKARQALFLSTGQMAQKLNISRAGYSKLERSEEVGAITISKLSQLAEAMDCELVYAIRPKNKLKFSEIIWQSIVDECKEHPWVKSRPDMLKVRALTAIARDKIQDTDVRRRRRNWSER